MITEICFVNILFNLYAKVKHNDIVVVQFHLKKYVKTFKIYLRGCALG